MNHPLDRVCCINIDANAEQVSVHLQRDNGRTMA